MSLGVYHAGGRVGRRVFRLVFIDVGREQVYRAARHTAATAATAAAAAAINAAAAARPGPGAARGAGCRVVDAGRSHARCLPHASQPVKRRRFRPLD